MARLLSGEVVSHCAMLTNIMASTSDSMELDLQSIMDLLCAAERRVQVSTGTSETSDTAFSILFLPGND